MTTYCSVEDVKRLLRLPFEITQSTNPSTSEVEDTIEEVEDEVDRLTGHSWRSTLVSDEYYDIDRNTTYVLGDGIRIKLRHRQIKSLDTTKGDKLEVWNGSEWADWLSDGNHTEGRQNDYWLDLEQGVLFIKYWTFAVTKFLRQKPVRMTYRYGDEDIPKDIRRATAMLVASDIVAQDDYSQSAPDTGDHQTPPFQYRADRWERKAAEILERRKEFWTV